MITITSSYPCYYQEICSVLCRAVVCLALQIMLVHSLTNNVFSDSFPYCFKIRCYIRPILARINMTLPTILILCSHEYYPLTPICCVCKGCSQAEHHHVITYEVSVYPVPSPTSQPASFSYMQGHLRSSNFATTTDSINHGTHSFSEPCN